MLPSSCVSVIHSFALMSIALVDTILSKLVAKVLEFRRFQSGSYRPVFLSYSAMQQLLSQFIVWTSVPIDQVYLAVFSNTG